MLQHLVMSNSRWKNLVVGRPETKICAHQTGLASGHRIWAVCLPRKSTDVKEDFIKAALLLFHCKVHHSQHPCLKHASSATLSLRTTSPIFFLLCRRKNEPKSSPGLMISWFNDVSVCKEFRMKALGLGRLEQTAQGAALPSLHALG